MKFARFLEDTQNFYHQCINWVVYNNNSQMLVQLDEYIYGYWIMFDLLSDQYTKAAAAIIYEVKADVVECKLFSKD